MFDVDKQFIRVKCDICDQRGPDAGSPARAVSLAAEEGWQRHVRLGLIVEDVCPDCAARLAARTNPQ